MSLTITVAQDGSRLHFQQLATGSFLARYYPSGSIGSRTLRLAAGRPTQSWHIHTMDEVVDAITLFPLRESCLTYLSSHDSSTPDTNSHV